MVYCKNQKKNISTLKNHCEKCYRYDPEYRAVYDRWIYKYVDGGKLKTKIIDYTGNISQAYNYITSIYGVRNFKSLQAKK